MVWLILVGFLVIVDLFITFVGAGLESDPRAQLFSPPAILFVGLAGLAGVWLSHRTGFPGGVGPVRARALALRLSKPHRDRDRRFPLGRRHLPALNRDLLESRWSPVQRAVPRVAALLSRRRDHRRGLLPAHPDPARDVPDLEPRPSRPVAGAGLLGAGGADVAHRTHIPGPAPPSSRDRARGRIELRRRLRDEPRPGGRVPPLRLPHGDHPSARGVPGLARRVRQLHLPLLIGHPGAAAGPGRSRVFTTAMISPSSPIFRKYAAPR